MSSASLEDFVKKYQTARRYNSKELRISLNEAEELSTAIALLLANTSVLQQKIIDLQSQLLTTRNEIEITGGHFT